MPSVLLNRVRHWLLDLNLFESGRREVEIGRQERWSTRVYLVLLFAAVFVLALYKGLGNETSQVTVQKPSQALLCTSLPIDRAWLR